MPDGDPEGVRIIDRMNWTGQGIVFPREKWADTRKGQAFGHPGVYILVGLTSDDDLPTIYVGEGDGIRDRIDSHYTGAKAKDFWSWGMAFISTNRGLNKAHVQWLEFALVNQATKAKRSHLDNGNAPQEPALTDSEKADTRGFLKEILQILPLVGLHAFEMPKAVATPLTKASAPAAPIVSYENDTVIVPAQKGGFEKVFLGEHCWHAIRISGGMLQKIKWIAAYQAQPISAITHVAPVSRIEPYGEGSKYKLVFSEPAKPITPIPFADAPSGAMQGPRYTTYSKLTAAKKLTDLVGKI
ncbi:GIY-YIG nuclease family protein [Belnapia sp. F-4-1]|uniref:GIY-YIG nuclease family protein n=1 Tax=Belnapia sp. F-4-1 TaxID=1545443 RepID=UPI001F32EDE1|nr:GIY-YIG nuclease family protein [Belnapia sp. F-4-1]